MPWPCSNGPWLQAISPAHDFRPKLQEIASGHNIHLSLVQILSFNIGVELGQITALLVIFPFLSMLRGKFFDKISKLSNWGLVVAGLLLLVYQLNGYFTDHHHHDEPINIKDHHHHHH